MCDTKNSTDTELIDILTEISVVSMRLARNLTLLAKQSQSKKGVKNNVKNERIGYGNQRTSQYSECY